MISYERYGGYIYFSKSPDMANYMPTLVGSHAIAVTSQRLLGIIQQNSGSIFNIVYIVKYMNGAINCDGLCEDGKIREHPFVWNILLIYNRGLASAQIE